MSIQIFIETARELYPEIDVYFLMRPELVEALKNDAVAIDKVFDLVPSFAALLDRYGMKGQLQELFFRRDKEFAKQPSSLRLLAQVFGHPWQHVNLEQALADAVAATRVSLGLDQECSNDGACGDCECDPGEDQPISVGITPDGNLAYTVSDEPLTVEEEEKFIDTLRAKSTPIPLKMWAAESGFGLEDIKKEAPVAEHAGIDFDRLGSELGAAIAAVLKNHLSN